MLWWFLSCFFQSSKLTLPYFAEILKNYRNIKQNLLTMASSKRCTGESGSVNDNVGFLGGFLGSFGDSGTGYFSSLTILEIKVIFLPSSCSTSLAN